MQTGPGGEGEPGIPGKDPDVQPNGHSKGWVGLGLHIGPTPTSDPSTLEHGGNWNHDGGAA